jgi:hypothetical protein
MENYVTINSEMLKKGRSTIKTKIRVFLMITILAASLFGSLNLNKRSVDLGVEATSGQFDIEKNDKYSFFTTDDKKIQFTLVNDGSFSEETINKIKYELKRGYQLITKEVGIAVDEQKDIMVILKEGVHESISGQAGHHSFDLYNIEEGTYPLIHELSHVLIGHSYETSAFLSEGIAEYLAEKYELWYPAYFDINMLMKYYRDHHYYIPLEDLLNKELEYKLIRPNLNDDLAAFSYTEAHSLAKYLINEYGIHKYMKVLKSKDAVSELQIQYNLTLEELEADWLSSLNNVSLPGELEEHLDKLNFEFRYP